MSLSRNIVEASELRTVKITNASAVPQAVTGGALTARAFDHLLHISVWRRRRGGVDALSHYQLVKVTGLEGIDLSIDDRIKRRNVVAIHLHGKLVKQPLRLPQRPVGVVLRG